MYNYNNFNMQYLKYNNSIIEVNWCRLTCPNYSCAEQVGQLGQTMHLL